MTFELTYWGLFMGCLLSATIIPFASEALFLGVLYNGGDPVLITVVATFGNFTGSLITYIMGYLGNYHHLERWFKMKPEKIHKWKKTIDQYGVWAAFLSWVPFVGDPLTLALGFFRVNYAYILPVIFIAKLIRYYALYLIFIP